MKFSFALLSRYSQLEHSKKIIKDAISKLKELGWNNTNIEILDNERLRWIGSPADILRDYDSDYYIKDLDEDEQFDFQILVDEFVDKMEKFKADGERGYGRVDAYNFPDGFWTPEEFFGTTENPDLAGYIRPDGTMLNFSISGSDRGIDHREINNVYTALNRGHSTGMREFMAEGNIRVLGQSGGLDISAPPTDAQRRRIAQFVQQHGGDVILDLSNGLGEYDFRNEIYYNAKKKKNVELSSVTVGDVMRIIDKFFGNRK